VEVAAEVSTTLLVSMEVLLVVVQQTDQEQLDQQP
jgi:hypothetical protein